MFYVDDMASKEVDKFSPFQQRFLQRLPQLNDVLTAFSDLLLRMCNQYDTITANSILSATFEFVNSTCIEPEIESLSLIHGVVRFPMFLRDRTGVSTSFALMLFPTGKRIRVGNYIQALPDMIFWISLSNDLLSYVPQISSTLFARLMCPPSFHKEELAGDTNNYVHNRAYIEGKSPIRVLSEMEGELAVARETIYAALVHTPTAADAWSVFERGYV